ncbi:gamma-glutamylcyclotransferase family protein [Photobacterium lucens]|uniref:gamma-glutamylcyclotransferase family protein n=1 Tax=Photobacterium lucens TaxID=2562949 RepID=UPI000D17785A|nr:gamma-glutamylcyclotransferase family protein [Photobacterium lucens]MBP2700688.1 gamma-glutamylcyclotransferase [Vibrio parahaemolyticus]MZG55277.1 gamma-glutamylcyclotransferase [Photobacterium lucens]MZG82986.1 gamma-glutamylcyclotransferase [Photobacterium lucens]PSV20846.1 gamma-glutamylcyclotransferase [Photobacterium leiognathi subsp. mandapamensis]
MKETLNQLFVYGTLAPDQSNAYVLSDLKGTWQKAYAVGFVYPNGKGATIGYPAFVPQAHGEKVQGLLFRSEELEDHWPRIDDFEGEGYDRVMITVLLEDGTEQQAFVYRLSPSEI